MVRAMKASASSKLASPASLLFTIVGDVKSSPWDVFRILIDDDVTGKEVASRPFDPQTYRREEVWRTIFQVEEVQNPLRNVLQNHEYD